MASYGQGYLGRLYLSADQSEPMQMEGVTFRVIAEKVDATASLETDEADGFTVIGFNGADPNRGAFTDCVGGPQTLFIDFNNVIRDLIVLSYFATLAPGDVLFDTDYKLTYGRTGTTPLYSGTGLYVEDCEVGLVVRGAATVRFRLCSTQHGFVRNTALAL